MPPTSFKVATMDNEKLSEIFNKNYEKHTLKKFIIEQLLKAINEEHWITIGADKETEKKGTHILVRDGETHKQATERKIAEWRAQKGKTNKPGDKPAEDTGSKKEKFSERYEKEKERLKQEQDKYYKINYESGQEIRKHREAVTELIKDITDKDKINEIVKKYTSAHPEIEDLNKKIESSYAKMTEINKELDKLKDILEEDINKEILDTNIDNLSHEDLQDLLDAVKYTENFSVRYETREKLLGTKRKIQDKIKSIEYNKTKKEVTQIAGVTKGKPMSFEDADNGRVNPNYGNHDVPGISFSQNCQSCVVCYQLRKNGFNVKTKGIPVDKNGNVVKSGKMYELAKTPELAWIDPKTGTAPEVNKCDGTTPKKAYKWLDENIKEGGTYSFRVVWKGAESGHIVIAHRVDGVLTVYDPQTNKEYFNETSIVDKFFDNCILRARYKSRKPYLFRTDNLDINPDYANEIVEKA